jgi:hypothetical protein
VPKVLKRLRVLLGKTMVNIDIQRIFAGYDGHDGSEALFPGAYARYLSSSKHLT